MKQFTAWAHKHLTSAVKIRLGEIATIGGMFVAWKLALQMLGFLATARFGVLGPIQQPWDPSLNNMLRYWAKWDSGWFLTIVQHGYRWQDAAHQSNIAFFPLYPVLTKLVSFPLELNYFVAGVIVSNLAFLGALFYLYYLVKEEFNSTTAYRALFFLLLFPTAFFYNTFYSESLFLLCTVAAFYHGRKNQWWAAGLWGGAAALTRFVGVTLLIPLVLEYLRQRQWKFHRIRTDLGWLVLIPLGLAGYMYYLKSHFANALLFIHAETAWQRGFQWPNHLLAEYWPIVSNLSNYFTPKLLSQALDFWFLVFYAVMLIALLVFMKRKSYALLGLLFLLPPLFSGTLESMPRYGMVIFPIYILLARAGKNPAISLAYTIFGTLLLAINVLLFVNWQWVA